MSNDLLSRRAAAVSGASARATAVEVARAEGAHVWDTAGRRYIDLAGGIGMIGAGHCPGPVVEALKEQLDKYLHVCSIVATYEPYVELCEMLNAAAPGDFAKKSLLANSGAEAVENAVKIARCHTGRAGIIVFEGAYHGRTNLTMAMTSKYSLFKKGFGPFASEIYRLPAPNVYRRPKQMTEEEYVDWCCDQLENALISHIDASGLAAIVIEPIQGEAGFVVIPPKFLRKIREICDRTCAVMIADEIQCGMGRTGNLWACEHSDIVPDMICTAKALGSGLPISATVGRAEIMDAPHLGGVGGTYGGSPLACRAAIETLKIINSPEFLAGVKKRGEIIEARLANWKERFAIIGDVRGVGMMRLLEFVKDRDPKAPDPDRTLAVIKRGVDAGLLLIRAGLYSNCIRLLPPMNIDEDLLREGLDLLEHAIEQVDSHGAS